MKKMTNGDMERIYRTKIISPYMCISNLPMHQKSREDFPNFRSYMLARINEILCQRPDSWNTKGIHTVQGILDKIECIYKQEQSELEHQLKPTQYDKFFDELGKE